MEELFDSKSAIPVSDLSNERAKDFVRYVLSGSNPAFTLTECRRVGNNDVVVVSARA